MGCRDTSHGKFPSKKRGNNFHVIQTQGERTMKKLLALGLAVAFLSASGMALADGTACTGKKCSGHHHKKGSKNSKGPSSNSAGPTGNAGPSK
jgi:hypothetical protein